jgi:serine/threonine protein kinase
VRLTHPVSFLEEPALKWPRSVGEEHQPPLIDVDDRLTDGTRLGDYTIRGHLGSGGLAAVYRAVDTLRGETVKMPDFGLATFTHAHDGELTQATVGVAMGTRAYMSPEQGRGQRWMRRPTPGPLVARCTKW